jgi:hypothetical protein
VVPDDLEPTERETTFAIDEHAVTEIDASGSRREYRLTESSSCRSAATAWPTYLDCVRSSARRLRPGHRHRAPAVVLLDDLVYVFASFDDRGRHVLQLRLRRATPRQAPEPERRRTPLEALQLQRRPSRSRLAMRAHDEAIQLAARPRRRRGEAEAQAEAGGAARGGSRSRAQQHRVDHRDAGGSPTDPVGSR